MNKDTSLFTKILPLFIIGGIIVLLFATLKTKTHAPVKIQGPATGPFESTKK